MRGVCGGVFSEAGGSPPDDPPPPGGGGGGLLPPVMVTLPEETLIGRYPVSLVTRTSYRLTAEVPDTDFAVKLIITSDPAAETIPGPTIRLYTLMIVPTELSMTPGLKNVVYPVKRSPSETAVAARSDGLNETFSSKALTGWPGRHSTVTEKESPAETV